MYIFLIFLAFALSSCANVQVNNDRYGFLPGQQEDSINWENTKYNLMDSPDGSRDPNANVKVWGATY